MNNKRIILLGLSGAGKPTLANFVRNSDLVRDDRVDIPMRITTRNPRRDDKSYEICHVSPKSFDGLVEKGNVKLHYTNQFDKTGTPKKYGFLQNGSYNVKLYHGGIGLVETYNRDTNVKEFIDETLVIGVVAGQNTRQQRIIDRSPESLDNPIEAQKRLSGKKSLIEENAHIIIDNSHIIEDVQNSFLTLVERVVHQLNI